jgi:hypothetical protein
MENCEIVNVGSEPYVDSNDEIDEEEDVSSVAQQIPADKKEINNENGSPFKSSKTIVPLDDKEEEKGFVPICSGTIGFSDQETEKVEKKENEEKEEIAKSSCCRIV